MTHLIQIGNSHGIRIPKSIINQAGLKDADLLLKVVSEGLLITPIRSARHGWTEACKEMHSNKEDKLLINVKITNQFDTDEWEW